MIDRRKQLRDIFKNSVSEEQFAVIVNLIDDFVFLEEQMSELKKLPFIRVNQNDPSQQRKTEAAKLYKEHSQSYMNASRILCALLSKIDTSAQDELLKKLEEFS
jgi:hypothetical protein